MQPLLLLLVVELLHHGHSIRHTALFHCAVYNRGMEQAEYDVQGDVQMQAFAAQFVAGLAPRPHTATVVALSGDLGAGKTTFAQGVAQALGIEGHVASPTFVLENIYPLENQPWHRLVHIDAYRLKGSGELAPLGWDMLIADPGNLILIEWPEQVADAVPVHATTIRLEDMGDVSRRVIVTYAN
ncbi:tRNA (adenosine(37)-N6)-threonylcarbamoyltransferase complex ATPase subunit type 1 TsaE [Candidatus Kaiserbacteria bacterium]|nr:tRNA (adenosine(37)-N6)-threonylcarbamoyltransferase complex ATPase subunit type 1 TsaE [Candidatus Kaiserbacteria bacterium]